MTAKRHGPQRESAQIELGLQRTNLGHGRRFRSCFPRVEFDIVPHQRMILFVEIHEGAGHNAQVMVRMSVRQQREDGKIC